MRSDTSRETIALMQIDLAGTMKRLDSFKWYLEILLQVAVGPMECKRHGAGSIHNGEMI